MHRSPSWIDPEYVGRLAREGGTHARRRSGGPGVQTLAQDEVVGASRSATPRSSEPPASARPSGHPSPGPGNLVHRVQLLGRWLRLVLEEHPHQVLDEDGLSLLHHAMPGGFSLGAQAERAALSLRRAVGDGPVRSIQVVAESGRSLTVAWFSTAQGRIGLGVLDRDLDPSLVEEIGIAFKEVFERP